MLVRGANWSRDRDTAGIAFARNGLSRSHRDYLAAGGLGFFLGDGRLSYRPEQIVEMFYSFAVHRRAWFTVNAQQVRDPAYNADRGPARMFGVRLHTNF